MPPRSASTLPSVSILILFATVTHHAASQPPPPPAFALSNTLASNMVLQRDDPTTMVFGIGPPDAVVSTTFRGATLRTTIGADTVWRQRLPPTPAGGPYVINGSVTAPGSGEFRIDNVLL